MSEFIHVGEILPDVLSEIERGRNAMTIIDLITSGRRMEKRSRMIRDLAEERDISYASAADIYDGMAEDAADERREIHGGPRPESQREILGMTPGYDGLD